jgi:hypothetical protein
MPKGIPESDKAFSVLHWGSHPDEDNDDCWTGEDFACKDDAIAAFKLDADRGTAYIEIDGLTDTELSDMGLQRVRKNPKYVRSKDRDETWQREIANEAGMLGGCDAYNEVMGWD